MWSNNPRIPLEKSIARCTHSILMSRFDVVPHRDVRLLLPVTVYQLPAFACIDV